MKIISNRRWTAFSAELHALKKRVEELEEANRVFVPPLPAPSGYYDGIQLPVRTAVELLIKWADLGYVRPFPVSDYFAPRKERHETKAT